jgi:hypothetical protein
VQYTRREPSRIDRVQLHERLERRKRTFRFAVAHQEEWRAVFPDQWIVAYDEKFIDADPDLEALKERVEELGIPFSDTYLNFLTSERHEVIL